MQIVEISHHLARIVTYLDAAGRTVSEREEWPRSHPIHPNYGRISQPRYDRAKWVRATDNVMPRDRARMVEFWKVPRPACYAAVIGVHDCIEGVKNSHGGIQELDRFKAWICAPIDQSGAVSRGSWVLSKCEKHKRSMMAYEMSGRLHLIYREHADA